MTNKAFHNEHMMSLGEDDDYYFHIMIDCLTNYIHHMLHSNRLLSIYTYT